MVIQAVDESTKTISGNEMHSTNNILLIKPANFGFNSETAESNTFQNQTIENSSEINQKATQEFNGLVKKLLEKGIEVTVVCDTENPIKPDAIFPNNWGSFHSDGTVVIYPMLAANRRQEKRKEITQAIGEKFEIKEVIDLSNNEESDLFLEGTGSIVFDHSNKIAYACISPRTNRELFEQTSETLGYDSVSFQALDQSGNEIYHTNVMMNIGSVYAVICVESIADRIERQRVIESLENSGKEIIEISFDQMNSFCGNMLELEIPSGKNILAMSQNAFSSFTQTQEDALERYCELLPLQIDTIEKIGGGSVRCMISEIFLPKKNTENDTAAKSEEKGALNQESAQ